VAWLTGIYGEAIDTNGFDAAGLAVKKTDERGWQLAGVGTAAPSGVKFTPNDAETAPLAIGTDVTLAIDPLAIHASRDAGTGQLRVPAYAVTTDGVTAGSVTFFYNGCKSAILGKSKSGGKSRLILATSAATTERAAKLAAEMKQRAAK
jgi:hypothetical protein